MAQQVTKILRTNVRVCDAAGPLYSTQLTAFFMDMLNVYKCYSEHISLAVARQVLDFHTLHHIHTALYTV
jgi:exportin-1